VLAVDVVSLFFLRDGNLGGQSVSLTPTCTGIFAKNAAVYRQTDIYNQFQPRSSNEESASEL
jgi:hypothetical protein